MSQLDNSPTRNSDEECRSKHKVQDHNASTPSPTNTAIHPLGIASSIHDSGTASKRKSAFLPYKPPNQVKVLTNLQRGNTEAYCPVEVTLSFHERCGQGEIIEKQPIKSELERRLQIDPKTTIDFTDYLGFTSLHWASYYGQLGTAQILIECGANVNCEAPEMVTPLLLAASGGHHEIVRLLLERGAEPKHMDIIGNTALMYAAAGNHPHTCNELLARDPDMTATNENGDTAYSLAIENGSTLAQAILEQYLAALLSL